MEAADKNKTNCSPLALDYVSKVLTHFHESTKFFIHKGSKIPILSEMLSEALEADLVRRISIFRQLGDTSLVVSGCFSEALSRRSVDLSYYQQMGETAYFHLSQLSDNSNVFDELSEEFICIASLIHYAFMELKIVDMSAEDLLNLYSSTESDVILKSLKEKGIVPFKLRGSGKNTTE